jgi:hypothetical protein
MPLGPLPICTSKNQFFYTENAFHQIEIKLHWSLLFCPLEQPHFVALSAGASLSSSEGQFLCEKNNFIRRKTGLKA